MVVTWRAAVLAAAGAVPLALWPVPGTVLVWAVVTALVCAVDVAMAASPRRVAVERRVPPSVRLTEASTSTLVLENLGRRTVRGVVRDAWVPSAGAHANRHRLDLPPGEARRVVTRLEPVRRGDRHADRVTVRTLGPLRVAGRQASLDVPGRLRVLPEFASRKHLPSRLARLRELDGRAAVQVRGEGTEFDSLREYVVGDDVRSIDWRATARRNDVVVRTWRPERDRRVLVVIDTGRTAAVRAGDGQRIDASIEAALLLGALAGRAGDRVGLLAFDRGARARVAGASGSRLLPALAEATAGVDARLVETDWPGLAAAVTERLSQRALVVLLTAIDPAAAEAGLLRVVRGLAARHTVVVAAVQDPEAAALEAARATSSDVYDAAAAARAELERDATAALLRREGAEVVDALPDDLAPRLADEYLALKAAGRL